MHFLVTGANGHLASSLRNYFAKHNHQVTCLARQALKERFSEHETFIQADLNHPLPTALAEPIFDCVFHCASQQPRQAASFNDYYNNNVQSLNNLINTLHFHPHSKVILFSSAVVYGAIRDQKINELTATDPQNDYALTKLMAEQVLKLRAREKGFTAYCLRLPSLFGHHQQDGLIHTYYTLVKQNQTLPIYSNGKLKRNALLFDDVVQAVEKIIDDTQPLPFNLYLLGSQNALTMEAIGQYLILKLNSHSQINLIEKKATVEVDWDFDLSHAIKTLKFQPRTLEASLDYYLDEVNHQS